MAMLGSKPLASLSSGLLARKGQAKPAMRSQGFGGFASSGAAGLDDLGWNDMGGVDPAVPVLVPLSAAVESPPVPTPVPPVVALRESLAERVEAEAVTSTPTAEPPARPAEPPARPVSLATAQRISRDSAKQTRKGKAAFTLRLDAERHLKVRLASALAGRSAQALVTEALDAFLESRPEVEALVAQLPPAKARR